jgi:hypothetical protein
LKPAEVSLSQHRFLSNGWGPPHYAGSEPERFGLMGNTIENYSLLIFTRDFDCGPYGDPGESVMRDLFGHVLIEVDGGFFKIARVSEHSPKRTVR